MATVFLQCEVVISLPSKNITCLFKKKVLNATEKKGLKSESEHRRDKTRHLEVRPGSGRVDLKPGLEALKSSTMVSRRLWGCRLIPTLCH